MEVAAAPSPWRGSVLFVVVTACLAYLVQVRPREDGDGGGIVDSGQQQQQQGYNQGTYNGAQLFIKEELYPDDSAMEGLVTAMLLYGTTVGALFSLSFLGRRWPLIIAACLFAGSGALLWWCPTVEVLLLGRAVTGFAAGVNTVNVPLYVAECAPATIRGHLVSLSYTMLILGILSSYVVNLSLSITGSTDWRLMLGIVSVPAVLVLCLLPFLPESPRFLVRKGRYSSARAVLVTLRGTDDADDELLTIVKGVFPVVEAQLATTNSTISTPIAFVDGQVPPMIAYDEETTGSETEDNDACNIASESAPLLLPPPGQQPHHQAKITDSAKSQLSDWRSSVHLLIFSSIARRAMIICIMLEFFQQFTGSQAVTFYTPTILKDSGIDSLLQALGLDENSSALLGSMMIYIIQLPFMVLGSRSIDYVGRRMMLLFTVPFLVIALITIGLSYTLSAGNAAAWLAFGGLLLFKCAYSPGLGPIPPIVESEIFPSAVRSNGLTIAAVCGSAFNIIVVQSFPPMKDSLGADLTFFLFAGMSVLAEIFIYVSIPETKLTVLEDTYRVLDAKKTDPHVQRSMSDISDDDGHGQKSPL